MYCSVAVTVLAVVGHGRDGFGDGDRAAGQNALDVALLACRKPNASNKYELLQTTWILGCHSPTTGSRDIWGLETRRNTANRPQICTHQVQIIPDSSLNSMIPVMTGATWGATAMAGPAAIGATTEGMTGANAGAMAMSLPLSV
jgi:hypothetical protein